MLLMQLLTHAAGLNSGILPTTESNQAINALVFRWVWIQQQVGLEFLEDNNVIRLRASETVVHFWARSI